MIVHLAYVNRYIGFKLQTKFIRDVNGAYKSLQISWLKLGFEET